MQGEFALIEALARQLKEHQRAPGVVQGIGDDAAVLTLGQAPPYLLATVDLLVEEIHFSRRHITATELGARALAVNVSDIAAMGGTPRYVLVSLAVPPDFPQEFLEQMYQGLGKEAQRLGAAVVGGNVSSSPAGLSVDIIVLGEVAQPLYRSGARAGDLLALSGTLGRSAAGLRWLRQYGHPSRSDRPVSAQARACVDAHLHVHPRVELARYLAQAGATAMIDSSDGLASEVNHLARASQVSLVVEKHRLPLSTKVEFVAHHVGEDPWDLALFGGEEYELVFTIPRQHWHQAQAASRRAGVPITRIGQAFASAPPRAYLFQGSSTVGEHGPQPAGLLAPEEGHGNWSLLSPGGWDHLRDAKK